MNTKFNLYSGKTTHHKHFGEYYGDLFDQCLLNYAKRRGTTNNPNLCNDVSFRSNLPLSLCKEEGSSQLIKICSSSHLTPCQLPQGLVYLFLLTKALKPMWRFDFPMCFFKNVCWLAMLILVFSHIHIMENILLSLLSAPLPVKNLSASSIPTDTASVRLSITQESPRINRVDRLFIECSPCTPNTRVSFCHH